mmetsp:Transcript_14947/g.45254  ORF Transcript_14947/g.45254 Transcript_14947/m.45254 type:complete len:304 (-) Transcript_14947:9-920(-)
MARAVRRRRRRPAVDGGDLPGAERRAGRPRDGRCAAPKTASGRRWDLARRDRRGGNHRGAGPRRRGRHEPLRRRDRRAPDARDARRPPDAGPALERVRRAVGRRGGGAAIVTQQREADEDLRGLRAGGAGAEDRSLRRRPGPAPRPGRPLGVRDAAPPGATSRKRRPPGPALVPAPPSAPFARAERQRRDLSARDAAPLRSRQARPPPPRLAVRPRPPRRRRLRQGRPGRRRRGRLLRQELRRLPGSPQQTPRRRPRRELRPQGQWFFPGDHFSWRWSRRRRSVEATLCSILESSYRSSQMRW